MRLEVGDEFFVFAVEQRLGVDRFVVRLLDLPEGVVEHALVAAGPIFEQGVQIDGGYAGAAIDERGGVMIDPLVGQVQRSAERCDGEGKGGSQGSIGRRQGSPSVRWGR
ncbi:MAG: hypothetical protein NVSMB19_23760 [Vulcanimicrobiaceae bacterium]